MPSAAGRLFDRAHHAALVFVLVLGAALAAVVGDATPAAAHASLEGAEPASDSDLTSAPTEVILRFDAPVSAELGTGIVVYGPDGRRIQRGDSAVSSDGMVIRTDVGDAGAGTYTVAWTVVSEDAHVLSGSYLYHVQTRTGSVAEERGDRTGIDIASWVARWMILSGMVGLGGLGTFFVAMRARFRTMGGRPARNLATAAGVVLAAGALARLVLQTAQVSGRTIPAALALAPDAVRSTRAGRFDAIRVFVALAALAPARRWQRWSHAALAAVAALGVAAVNALSGHAWTSGAPLVGLAVDVVHQGAGAVWVGGLVGLHLAARNRPDAVEWTVRRFSALAGAALAAVGVTGVISGWLQVRTLDGLRTTDYGRILMVKVALVAVMVGLGWVNRERLAAAVASRSAVLRNVRAEAAAGLIVVAVTAALVGAVPARDSADEPWGPQSQLIADGAGSVGVTVTPAQPGANALHLYFYDEEGRIRDVDAAEARVATEDVPPRRIDLLPIAPGHFSAATFTLPTPGRWVFSITTLTGGVPSALTFEVAIR